MTYLDVGYVKLFLSVWLLKRHPLYQQQQKQQQEEIRESDWMDVNIITSRPTRSIIVRIRLLTVAILNFAVSRSLENCVSIECLWALDIRRRRPPSVLYRSAAE